MVLAMALFEEPMGLVRSGLNTRALSALFCAYLLDHEEHAPDATDRSYAFGRERYANSRDAGVLEYDG